MSFIVVEMHSEPPGVQSVETYGPFETQQQANAHMQHRYDEWLDTAREDSVDESDDSDGGHFYIKFDGGDYEVDWVLTELIMPE